MGDNDVLSVWIGGFANDSETTGKATVSFTQGSSTVTETVTTAYGSASTSFTQESGNSALYQLTPTSFFGFFGEVDLSNGLTYGFSGIGGSSVTETITATNQTTTLTYDLASGSTSQYVLASETVTYTPSTSSSTPTVTYAFTESGSTVTGITRTVTEGSYSYSANLSLNPTDVFTIASGTVTETSISGNSVETVTYSGSGSLYSISAIKTSFIAQGSATTALDVNPYDRVDFTISGGTVTALSAVSASGTVTPLSSNSHIAYSLLATGFVEEVVTHGSQTSYVVFYEASGSGPYTEIAHGHGSSVDLVGLKAQLAQLPSSIGMLI
jgi:hypothetical protein